MTDESAGFGRVCETLMPALGIAGFHRSGTSMTARIFADAGMELGEELVGASPSNPYGHFEDFAFVRFHNRVLADNGETWQVTERRLWTIGEYRWAQARALAALRSRSPSWAVKDPRMCLFMPFWKHLLPDMKVLVVYRDPLECQRSLHNRHARELTLGQGPEAIHRRFFEEPHLAIRMWLAHNDALIDFHDGHLGEVMVVSMEDIVGGHDILGAVNSAWGWSLEASGMPVVDRSALDRRPADPGRALPADLQAAVDRTWQELEDRNHART